MSRLDEKFARARAEGRAAFIAYLTAGDPSIDETVALATALESAGADVLELGVPFSDPIADGPVHPARRRAGARPAHDPRRRLRAAQRIRAATDLALVLFSYVNPLMRYGPARRGRGGGERRFRRRAADRRSAGGGRGRDAGSSSAAGLDTIFLVSPTSDPARMRAAARLSRGFLYVVSRPGPTGARAALPPDLARDRAPRARGGAARLPVAVGFGIGTPEAARRAARLADGVVVGSALVAAAEAAPAGRRAAAVVGPGRTARPRVPPEKLAWRAPRGSASGCSARRTSPRKPSRRSSPTARPGSSTPCGWRSRRTRGRPARTPSRSSRLSSGVTWRTSRRILGFIRRSAAPPTRIFSGACRRWRSPRGSTWRGTSGRGTLLQLRLDADARVVASVLENRFTTEPDVILAAARTREPAVLELIAAHPRWIARSAVRSAVLRNTALPRAIALGLLEPRDPRGSARDPGLAGVERPSARVRGKSPCGPAGRGLG